MREADPSRTALALLDTLTPLLPAVRLSLATLASLIPASQFYRYHDSFSRSLQFASSLIVLSTFLRTEDVASKADVEAALGSTSFPGPL